MRSLMAWNPYRELTNWHRDIDDLFRRLLSDDEAGAGSPGGYAPAMEAFEKDGRFIVRADLPGVDPNEVEVSLLDNTLTVKGERKRSKDVNEKDYRYSETVYGSFERRFSLPAGVDADKITAKFEHGVIEVSVPLPESSTVKRIPIESGSTQRKQIKAA